jgi:hypothetical protein
MAKMIVRVTNSTFESVSMHLDFATVDDAYTAAIKAGLEIAATEVANGANSSIVELAVDLEGQPYAARGALAVSTARIFYSDGVV